jgi:hypothetical protein
MPDANATVFAEIDRHFLAPEALKRAALVGRVGGDAGGWFRAELAYVLDSLLKAGKLREWRGNVAISEDNRQRCDFRIEVADSGPLWFEVKAISDPARAGPLADTAMFARGSTFTDDIVKLLRVPEGERAVLLFVYPRPEPGRWGELMSSLARRIAPISFTEESAVADYPPELYVCRLSVSEGF